MGWVDTGLVPDVSCWILRQDLPTVNAGFPWHVKAKMGSQFSGKPYRRIAEIPFAPPHLGLTGGGPTALAAVEDIVHDGDYRENGRWH